MNTLMLKRAALVAAVALPAAAPAFASVNNGMQSITPGSFQSFNGDADSYTMRGGVVVKHTPAFTPGASTGRTIGVTPASLQSFIADEDRYTIRNGATTMTPAPALPPAAPARAEPYSMHTASASRYVDANGQRAWVPAQGFMSPAAEDGPDSLKGD